MSIRFRSSLFGLELTRKLSRQIESVVERKCTLYLEPINAFEAGNYRLCSRACVRYTHGVIPSSPIGGDKVVNFNPNFRSSWSVIDSGWSRMAVVRF